MNRFRIASVQLLTRSIGDKIHTRIVCKSTMGATQLLPLNLVESALGADINITLMQSMIGKELLVQKKQVRKTYPDGGDYILVYPHTVQIIPYLEEYKVIMIKVRR